MTRERLRQWSLALATCLTLTLIAHAAVTFDPDDLDGNGISCEGFAGKGDVQSTCGWNDPQLTANLGNVTFFYATSQRFTWDCVDLPPAPVQSNITDVTTIHAVGHSVVYGARQRGVKPITGFNLMQCGAGESTFSNGQPNQCPSGYRPANQNIVQGSAAL